MQFCSTLCWFANILCNSIFLHMCKLVHGGQKWAFIQVERCKQWLYIQSWWWWLDAREHFWTTWSFCTTESYSHVVRWLELTVGCEVNNHSPSPVQGERGWVHCVHKNWSRLNTKRHHDISWNIFNFQGWKKVNLLHSCFVSSSPQSLAARKSSWCGFNNWGWSQIVQQH